MKMEAAKADKVMPAIADPMVPQLMSVAHSVRETDDVVTLEIDAPHGTLLGFQPGQFNMLYAFGVGEVPISISGNPGATDRITHTIRAVGAVSQALTDLKHGDQLGVRGPFGSSWPTEEAKGYDVLVIAGGIGLVPLRPVIYHLLEHREAYGRIALIYGARTQADLIFHPELEAWRRTPDFQVRVTLNFAGPEWSGDVGHVTKLLPRIRFDPADTVAMICGPEVMIRATALALADIGLASEQIYASLERNMKCAIGLCGHCQFGPHFVCKDGPVYCYDRIRDLLAVQEF